MKTTLTATLAALLVTFALASCANRGTAKGMHNMATGPKDRMMMPDANMPARR